MTLLILLVTAGAGNRAAGSTGLDLSDRMEIDGFSQEYEEGEEVFGLNEDLGVAEESMTDSKWGAFNDVNQIKITWDREFLYVAVDGFIFDNNMILWMDVLEDSGLDAMTEINSWRRNFVFSPDFTPDLFLATWDGNPLPQIWTYTGPNQVTQVSSTSFSTVATFEQSAEGRSMEAAIPWSILFLGESERLLDQDLDAEVWTIPEAMDTLRFAAAITAGPDGTGGPDSAPDNFGGHTIESSDQVTIDNYAILPLDLDEIQGIPDFGIAPEERITFKRQPPIRGITFKVEELAFDRAIVSPEEGLPLRFRIALSPPAPEDEEFRTVTLTAEVYDSLGNFVDLLYSDDPRSAQDPSDPEKDQWDGRDSRGRMVPGGVYILSVVSEPGLSRSTKAFAVVR